MILSAIAEKLKRRSKNDFKGRHFAASLICRLFCYGMFKVQERIVNVRSYIRKFRRGLEPVRWFSFFANWSRGNRAGQPPVFSHDHPV